MGTLGAGMIVYPLVAASGLVLLAASPVVVLGVILVVLCAFHPRIDGPVRYRQLSIPIGPPGVARGRQEESGTEAETPTPPPSPSRRAAA